MLILYRISDTQSNWSLYQPSDKWEITYLTRRSHIAHAIFTGYEARDGARTNEQFCTVARDAMIRTKERRREIKFSRPAHADLCSGKLIKSHTRNSDAYEWYCLTLRISASRRLHVTFLVLSLECVYLIAPNIALRRWKTLE